MCRTFLISICRREKYFAKRIMRTSFAGSAGSNENAPNENQLFAPWDTLPNIKSAIKVAADKEKSVTDTHVERKNLKSSWLNMKKAKSEMMIQKI